ncbi:MAG: class I adenylate cyclase [Gammaproteobacteria bacterium]|nr:class I adenylate cyclase [Gammaproteobacteria bacterium]
MDLIEVTKLFNAHNRSRIERLLELAPPAHQTFLQFLPLIFQSNDSALPCYVEGAPFGIVDYQPSNKLLALAKKNHPTLSYSKHAFRHYPIQGLYLINDVGALYYPDDPQFDLWLIYSSDNTEQQIQLLKTKLHDSISLAKSLGIKLNARLLNDTAIKEYKIESDDLDRFYSSGLILAGSIPLWWLLTPEQELDYQTYARQLISTPPVDAAILDFGPLEKHSASVLVDTAIKASLAALNYGLPCFLELFFQQTLLDHLSDNLWLSPRYKQAIYSKETNTFFCEPLILKYELVSEKISSEFIPYLQRSLYLLANERLSSKVTSPRFPWRRDNMADLVNQWQWNKQELAELDQRNQAQIRQRLDEFKLTKTLTQQFNSTLSGVIKSSAPDASKKFVLLQKAFQDLFDSPPDVIPCLPESLIPDVSEDILFIEFDPASRQWRINEIERTTLKKDQRFSPLYSSASLLLTVAWAIINGALSKYTRVKLLSTNSDVSTTTLYSLIEQLVKSPLVTMQSSDEHLIWLLFANTEITPKQAYKQQDIKLALRLRDPLNYGYHRRNMVLCLEVITRSKDNIWHYLHNDSVNAVGETLANFVRWHSPTSQQNYVECWCPTPSFASNISKRITTLCQHLSEHVQHAPENGIYILEVGDQLCRIQWQQQHVDATLYARRYDLDTILSLTRNEFYATHVDQNLDHEGLYQLLLKDQNRQQIRVFIDSQKSHIDVYILDELGHLDKQQFSSLKETTLLTNLNQFLSAVAATHHLSKPHFYKLHNIYGAWSLKALPLPSPDITDSYLPVQVKMEQVKTDSPCTIKCGPKQFSGKANDAALFDQVSQFMLSLRQSSSSFSLYITELTFEQITPITTTHDHLIFKQHLENLLNKR